MPSWWRKRSSRSKDSERENANSARGSSVENGKTLWNESKENKAKSFDEVSGIVLRQKQSKNSPRNSRDYAAIGREERGSSGFSGFDSASSLDVAIGHPLPMPVDSSTDHVQMHGVGSEYGSGFSSTGSSGSTEDQAHVVSDKVASRRNGDNKSSPVMRSPGRGLKGITTTTSPLHPRFGGINLDSPTGKLEDGKSECHRLPLPPGSPSSPSALPTPRSPGRAESSNSISSKWRKGRLLGRGTFGHVYQGFNCENGQMCAIKEVRVVSDDQSSKECLKQLNQEITLLSQLSHVNIVQYYGSDLSEETLSVYLEYVSGGSIHKLLQEYGPFGEPVIQNYTRQILSGLAYLHGRNTVHRDIKGANILVDPNGEIKLADFGMAKHITSCSSMLSFKGSPYWMAPEVVMNTNGYSLAVDIWSLGCTILEMATSKPPWSQFEGVAAIFKIGNSKDMPEIPDYLSNDAKSFIRLCLQREPSARPAASQLLGHPFVRNQSTIRAASANISREAFPRAFDGSRTPTALEMQSSRLNNFSFDRDDPSRSPVPRTLVSPRESARAITSLPVSPSSSPLRHHGPAHKSCFISPPHPSYPFVGQSSNNYGDHLVFPVRPTTRNTFDPWFELPQFKSQIPVRSPTRTIL